MMFSSKKRIESCLNNKKNPHLSGSFGKKGAGGLFVKDGSELVGGAKMGIELRTLELEVTRTDNLSRYTLLSLLKTVGSIANMLYGYQNDPLKYDSQYRKWREWVVYAKEILGDQGVIFDKNWGKPHQNREVWESYVYNFNDLKRIFKGCEFTFHIMNTFGISKMQVAKLDDRIEEFENNYGH
jgi:hypothetical protein